MRPQLGNILEAKMEGSVVFSWLVVEDNKPVRKFAASSVWSLGWRSLQSSSMGREILGHMKNAPSFDMWLSETDAFDINFGDVIPKRPEGD